MDAGAVKTQILQTKLYPPRLPPVVIRQRLLDELDAARTTRLTTVVAGAGYGKSTLAAGFFESREIPYVWYEVEESDRDLSLFVRYLVTGIQAEYSGFGERTLDYLESTESLPLDSKAVLTTLLSEMETHVDKELFIVFDDYQEIDDSKAITEAIEFLLDHIALNLHIMILSRGKLELDVSELRARRELLEFEEKELCFTTEETSRLFSEVFSRPLKQEDAARLTRVTEGWVTGLVLFHHALKGKTEEQVGTAFGNITTPTEVHDYLSGAVYLSESDEVKEFLLGTSILARMNPEFCDQLLGIDESRRILDYLDDERLFIIPLDERGDWYRYNHFFRSYLRQICLATYSEQAIEEKNNTAGDLWMKYGEPELALRHYLEARNYEKAADVLEEIVEQLRKTWRTDFLASQLNSLPESVLFEHPLLVYNLAEINDLIAHDWKAMEGFRKAADLFEEQGDVEAQARSLLGLARVLSVTGNLDEGREVVARVQELLPGDSVLLYEGAAVLGAVSTFAGLPDAEHWLEEALQHVDQVEDDSAKLRLLFSCGLATFNRGDFKMSIEILSRAFEIAERSRLATWLPIICAFLSCVNTILGRLEEAKDLAEKGLSYSDQMGLEPMMAANRATRAVALAIMGDREEALEDISVAISQIEGYQPAVELLLVQFFAGEVFMFSRMPTEAVRHFRIAEKIAREANYTDLESLAWLGIVFHTLNERDVPDLIEEVKTKIETLESTQSGLALGWFYGLLVYMQNMVGQKDAAQKTMERLVERGQENESMWGWFWFGDRYLPYLADVFSRGEYLDYVARVFATIGTDSLPYVRELVKSDNPEVREKASELLENITRESAEPLVVKMFGPFEVEKGDQRISAADWKSKRALMVFKYLAAYHREGLVPRDVLMELLWPDSDPESASKNLNVALTSLRKTLEPQAGRGESSYLTASGDSLRLELGNGGLIDTELFEEKLSRAREAGDSGSSDLYLKILEEAEELYRGDYLAEDLYEEWCQLERESLRSDYVDLIADIAEEHLRRAETDEALEHLDIAIRKDPGREGLYRKQMEIFSRVGNRAGIERAYERCCTYLEENFEVSPSPETRDLYQKLRGD